MSSEKQARFAAMFRQHAHALQRYLRSKVRSRDTAEDLMQEAFVRAYASSNETLHSPRNFLFRTAHNLAVNHLRNTSGERMRPVADIETMDSGDVQCTPDETLHWREQLALLDRLIDGLPPQCRQVFILQKLEHRSHREIASQLGIAVSTVEKHIARAIKLCYQQYLHSSDGSSAGLAGDVAARAKRPAHREHGHGR